MAYVQGKWNLKTRQLIDHELIVPRPRTECGAREGESEEGRSGQVSGVLWGDFQDVCLVEIWAGRSRCLYEF